MVGEYVMGVVGVYAAIWLHTVCWHSDRVACLPIIALIQSCAAIL